MENNMPHYINNDMDKCVNCIARDYYKMQMWKFIWSSLYLLFEYVSYTYTVWSLEIVPE